jgi:UDP-N-acetylglucosamine 2-epimerase (non-hydrolysing)
VSRARVLLVFGTRPEAIKMAPVVTALRRRPERFDARICLTGQHREMLDQVMEAFSLTADVDLDLMRADQSPSGVAAGALTALASPLASLAPDVVLVQGDTITTFAAAFAAYLQKIRVGHVEAGLRTDDRYRPFPEEMTRRLTTACSDYHFSPTEWARANLLREGVPDAAVVVTGNTVVDALLATVRDDFVFELPALRALDFARPTILVTMHRRESHGAPLAEAAEAIRLIATARPRVQVVFPVHRNPNVRGPIERILGAENRIHLIDPLDYRQFVHLMARSTLALTDSGGIQEEAPSLRLPVLVLRDVTERPEAVEAGTSRLVGTRRDRIVTETLRLIDDHQERARMTAVNPYGDGRAAERIVDALERMLGQPGQP